jgi:DNA-directed RNA polymerase specialized sigma subunit
LSVPGLRLSVLTGIRSGLEEEPNVGQTARKAQRERADERDARLEKARRRRLELDRDREARDARVDAAVADVYQAQDEREAAARAIEVADLKIGEVIVAILAEGVALAQVAELTELSVNQVQRLRAAAAEVKHAGDRAGHRAAVQVAASEVGAGAGQAVETGRSLPLAGGRPATAPS